MATLLVTVAWRGRRRDLAVPADVPIADLLRPLAAAMLGGDMPGTHTGPSAEHHADVHGDGVGPDAMHRTGVDGGYAGPGGAEGPVSGSHWAQASGANRPGGANPGGAGPGGPGRPGGANLGRVWGLAPLAGAPLPGKRALGACGVGDGAVLVLLE